jgi:hypothetical protein
MTKLAAGVVDTGGAPGHANAVFSKKKELSLMLFSGAFGRVSEVSRKNKKGGVIIPDDNTHDNTR